MKIVVIDGQGGRLGKLLVEAVKERLPQAEVLAVGTNGIATATMQKAGPTMWPPEKIPWSAASWTQMWCWALWASWWPTPSWAR